MVNGAMIEYPAIVQSERQAQGVDGFQRDCTYLNESVAWYSVIASVDLWVVTPRIFVRRSVMQSRHSVCYARGERSALLALLDGTTGPTPSLNPSRPFDHCWAMRSPLCIQGGRSASEAGRRSAARWGRPIWIPRGGAIVSSRPFSSIFTGLSVERGPNRSFFVDGFGAKRPFRSPPIGASEPDRPKRARRADRLRRRGPKRPRGERSLGAHPPKRSIGAGHAAEPPPKWSLVRSVCGTRTAAPKGRARP